MATETALPTEDVFHTYANNHPTVLAPTPDHVTPHKVPRVLTTIYDFPSMEPVRFASYSANQLHLPLRRDILHRAVVYEGDMTRQGTASTKWRADVHGSNRKILPQKGTGQARAGDKKSPIRRGGGVAFGPHPRDMSTDLPRKIYDLAWRTALSHRYRKGELIIVGNEMDILEGTKTRAIRNILEGNHWGNADGRSLLVTQARRERIFDAMEEAGDEGRILTMEDVDVKNLLELGKIVIEKSALDWILSRHSTDLKRKASNAAVASA